MLTVVIHNSIVKICKDLPSHNEPVCLCLIYMMSSSIFLLLCFRWLTGLFVDSNHHHGQSVVFRVKRCFY